MKDAPANSLPARSAPSHEPKPLTAYSRVPLARITLALLSLHLAACATKTAAPTVVSSSVGGKVYTSVVIPPAPQPTLAEQLLSPLSAIVGAIAPYLLPGL